MFKTLLIASQLFALFLFNMAYTPREVKLSHDLPSKSIVGSEHWVYVDIDKSKLGGFAKYQVDVPKGMQIEPGDIRGASFTFAEGAGKFIWMSLPQDHEFQISYKLLIYDDVEIGNNVIKQRFAYLEKNERKVLDIDDHVVFVDEENVSNEYVPDTLANGTRSITKLNNDHYLVQLKLYKDGIKGFAKVEEFIPEGMHAEAVNKERSVFTQQGNKVKFVWFTIPEEENITLTYEVFSDEFIAEEDVQITGEFTYLRNNESKTIRLEDAEDPSILAYLAAQNQVDTTTLTYDQQGNIMDTTVSVGDPDTLADVADRADEATDEVTETVDNATDIPDEVAETVDNATDIPDEVTETVDNATDIPDEVTETVDNATDIPDEIAETVDNATDIPEEVVETVDNATDIPDEVAETVDNATDIPDEVAETVDNATDIPDEIAETVDNATDIPEEVAETVDNATDIPDEVAETVDNATDIPDEVAETVDNATDIPDEVTEIVDNATDIPDEIAETVDNATDIPDEVAETMDNTSDITAPDPQNTIPEETEAVAETTNVVYDTPDIPDTDTQEVVSQEEVDSTEEVDTLTDISGFPSADRGVNYRVQIMAGKNVVDEKYLKSRHRFTDDFIIENHESWVKYTTGSYGIYKEARDKRNHITDNYNFDGPFVTAYNDGARITVQEALMITRQTWYQ